MNHVISLALIHYAIFSDQFNRIGAKPMIGHNIVNAQANEYPFVVSLMRVMGNDSNPLLDHICTGTLISRKDVVTSEHCIESEILSLTKIVLGNIDLRRGRSHYIFWWITYEQWAAVNDRIIEFSMNDIAMIRLMVQVPQSLGFALISDLSNNNLYNTQVKIVAWGRNRQPRINARLKVGTLKVISHEDCIRRVSSITNDRVTFDYRQALCTSADPYILLNDGDSGGPLMQEDRIVGISKGICPDMTRRNRQLVNIHIAVYYYKIFLDSIIAVP